MISIHAAREGGDDPNMLYYRRGQGISIHAAREGGDQYYYRCQLCKYISIHAAREGGDFIYVQYARHHLYFNPRRP